MNILRSPLTWMALGIVVLVTLQMSKPEELDWTYTFEYADKGPNGGWIPAHYLEQQFGAKVKQVNTVLWSDSTMAGKHDDQNYVIITSQFAPDDEARDILLSKVVQGMTLFIASDHLDDSLAELIGVKHKFMLPESDTLYVKAQGGLVHHVMRDLSYADTYEAIDTAAWHPLASIDSEVVLTTRTYGAGRIILCGTPALLTNQRWIDKSQRAIPISILSSLPSAPVVWDDYYKPHRQEDATVTKAIGAIPGLSMAFWLLLLMGLMYLIVVGRRRQRAIPIIEPVRNSSLEFVSTVGRLYFRRHDNLNLANKLSRLFKDHVVNKLRLRVDVDEQTLAYNISESSGADITVVSNILRRISHAESLLEFSDQDVIEFHNDIQTFHTQSSAATATVNTHVHE